MRRLDSGQLHRVPNNLISKICLDIFSLKFFQRWGDQEATGEGEQPRDSLQTPALSPLVID